MLCGTVYVDAYTSACFVGASVSLYDSLRCGGFDANKLEGDPTWFPTICGEQGLCPEGHVCPAGTSRPQPCEAGKYCAGYLKTAATDSCKEGFFCSRGTKRERAPAPYLAVAARIYPIMGLSARLSSLSLEDPST